MSVDALKHLPREIAPGIFWLGACLEIEYQGRIVHSYNSVFVVAGDDSSAIIETGITSQNEIILTQLASLEERDLPDPVHVLFTHSEMAHAGGVGKLLARYPKAVARGEATDLHLVFPEFTDRIRFVDPGERFDLGGTEIRVVESVFRDLVHTRWYFDTKRRVLFPGDGFAYSHYHEDGACGHFAEEVAALDIPLGVRRFTQSAFHWTQFVDMEPYLDRLDELVFEELDTQLIAPTHGLPISNPATTMKEIRRGFVESDGSTSDELLSKGG
jgi:flavorubredoxin